MPQAVLNAAKVMLLIAQALHSPYFDSQAHTQRLQHTALVPCARRDRFWTLQEHPAHVSYNLRDLRINCVYLLECGKGKASSLDQLSCVNCTGWLEHSALLFHLHFSFSAGFFQSQVGQSSCSPCVAGQISSLVGQTACSKYALL